MSCTVLVLLVGLLSLLYLWLRRHYSYWADLGVPHEQPVYFLGNMRGIGRQYNFRDIDERIYKRFKGQAPFVGFYSFLNKAAFILDLDLIKQIMVKDFGSFANRGLFHNVRDDPLTENLLQVDGEQWSTLRHKMSPVFSTGKIRSMFPIMVAVSERLLPAAESLLQQGSSTLELKELCARYTTDVIGSCAFGLECNSLQDPQAEFRQMGKLLLEKPRHSVLVQAFMFSDPATARRLRMKMFRDDSAEFFMNAVRQTVEYRIKNQIKRNDFMDMLIEMKLQRDRLSENDALLHDDMSNGLTMQQVAAQALVFFLAGFDTSSTTMAFCLYELALNEQIQHKLRAEIQKVLQQHNNQLSYEALHQMPYLEKVVSETLRKYSVLPHMIRLATTDYQVPNSNIVFPKGMRMTIPVDAIHNDPAYYPEPQKFDPERFSPEEIEKRPAFAYFPFGDGPRNCIGNRFGKIQAKIGIVTLVANFRFAKSPQTQMPLRYSKNSFLVQTESGIHIDVQKC